MNNAELITDHTIEDRINMQRCACSFALLFVLIPSASFAQLASKEKYTPEELHKHFENVASAYDIQIGDAKLELRKQSLMHWQNPVRQSEQGDIFVWLRKGRPQVIGTIFTYHSAYRGGTLCRHEMISLADAPFESGLDGAVIWAPEKPGVKWTAVKETIVPAETTPRRLLQMRTIARTFDGVLHGPEDNKSKLTLIPQPMLRYESPEQGVVDGAIFSLAVATDPEIFLVIEAQKADDGTLQWKYAAARAHYYAIDLNKDGQRVWHAEHIRELQDTTAGQTPWMNEPYFTFFESKPLPAPEALR